jgi:farnesyl-diphosphate farnesyltransferase
MPVVYVGHTLHWCFNHTNAAGVVKLRRGLTARVFDEVASMSDVFTWYLSFLEQLEAKVEREVAAHDPSLSDTAEAVGQCLELCRQGLDKVSWGLRI